MTMNFIRPTSTALALVLLGLIIRILCSTGELWFDELWTVSMTRNLDRVYQAFTIPHDNRHPLTSFWIQFIPTTFPHWVFRMESLLFSAISAVTLLVIVTNSQHRTHYLLWLLFYTTSYLFILYDSEARGYAGMIACVLMLYLLKHRIFFATSAKSLPYFTALSTLGMLSHALFVTFLIPYVAWGWYVTVWSNAKWRTTKWVTVTTLFLLLVIELPLYAKMEIGGAPLLPYIQVIGSTLLLSFGGDAISSFGVEKAVWQLLFGMTLLLLTLVEIVLWTKEERDEGVFLLFVITSPLLAVVVAQPYFILPRYFLVPVLFTYLILAKFLTRLSLRGGLGTFVATSTVVAFLLFNSRHTYHLYAVGRSQLGNALSFIAKQSPRATIGGNREFQMEIQLPLHVVRNPTLQELTFHPNYEKNSGAIDYILIEHIDRGEPSPESLMLQDEVLFRKVLFWRAPPESGANLSVYKRNTGGFPDSSLFLREDPR